MYWVSYYLQKGHKLDYLLRLNEIEKIFFIEALKKEKEEIVKYDTEKMSTFLEALGGD